MTPNPPSDPPRKPAQGILALLEDKAWLEARELDALDRLIDAGQIELQRFAHWQPKGRAQ